MRPHVPQVKAVATAFVVLVAKNSTLPWVAASDVIHNGAWPSGNDCVDHSWDTDLVYVFRCHGETNQQWQITSEDQIISVWGKCLEYFDDQDKVVAVPCDNRRRQKWYATNGLIKPQGFRLPDGSWSMRVGFCLDAAQPDGHLTLFGCHGNVNQKFSASFLPALLEDVVQVGGSWAKNGNCVDYDYSSNVAYVYSCHGQWNQRWRFSSEDELRVGDNKCLEYNTKDQVLVNDCNKAETQKWAVLDDGHVQPKALPSKCLDAAYATSKLGLAACVADKANQRFSSPAIKPKNRDLLQVRGPWADPVTCVDYAWGTDYAYVYNCHGQANQLWEFTNDEQIRTTEKKCLEFDGDGLKRVSVKPCNSQLATQRWHPKATGEIVPRGYFDSKNSWRVPNKCLDAALEDKKLQLWDCVDSALNQKYHSNAMPTRNRDYLFADGSSTTPGTNCVRAVDSFVVVATCSATREMLWEFKSDGSLMLDVDGGLCLTASNGGSTGKLELTKCSGVASQKWERTATGAIALQAGATGWGKCLDWVGVPSLSLVACGTGTSALTQKFSSSIFTTVSSGALNTLFEKAAALSSTIKTDAFLSSKVLASASEVVVEAGRVLSTGEKADKQRAIEFLRQFISKNDNATDFSVQTAALYETSTSEEFLVSLALLLQTASITADGAEASVLNAITPAITMFSEQLYEARYEALLDHVVRGDISRVEAYSDGTLSDFNEVGGILTAACDQLAASPSAPSVLSPASSMCKLASYFKLIDEFFQLKYRLLVEGPRGVSDKSRNLARAVAGLFKSNQSLLETDPLWKRLMTLLVFGAPFIDALPTQTLARASRGDAFLPTFVVYNALGNDKYAVELTPMTYMAEPFNTYSVLTDTSASSDFAMVALYIVPLVCGDPARAPLSLCQLEEVYNGLQTVLSFEHSRRSSIVSLDDVLEVDVRKKLDVIDQEKKQFELMSTLQEVANKIGTTLLKGFADLRTQIATSTATIRSDIEATRKDLRDAIGSVGEQLQTSIEQSTDLLYTQVGQQAKNIRQDIFDSSQRLEQRLDDAGRAILGSIEQSKQELKCQIGAEAERTRNHISAKTAELKDYMSRETQGLREFVDVKTNQVIGVVREEGATTREEVNKATNQIVRVVQQEGAITRAFVDTKTNEVKEVVRSESQKTREYVDMKTNQVINVVREEGQTTRSYVDEKGNQVIGIVKEEGDKTRKEVRAEGMKIREHVDEKSKEIVRVVKDEGAKTRSKVNEKAAELKKHVTKEAVGVKNQVAKAQKEIIKKGEEQFAILNDEIGRSDSTIGAIVGNIVDTQSILLASSTDNCADMWSASSGFRSTLLEYRDAKKALGDFLETREGFSDDVMFIFDKLGFFKIKGLDNLPGMYLIVRTARFLLEMDFDRALAPTIFDQYLKSGRNPMQSECSAIVALAQTMQTMARQDDKWSDYKSLLSGQSVEFMSTRWESFRLTLPFSGKRSQWDAKNQ